MLYKKNSASTLDKELFKKPTSEYRGTPFWAWNSALKADELCRQIDIFKEMGLGGFHMHVRTGLEDEYLGKEFMKNIETCVNKAKNEQMLAWLYDEDRWASGAAGGIVTVNHAYRQRYISFSPDYEKTVEEQKKKFAAFEDDDIKLLTCYDIQLDDEGYLISYKQINKDDEAQGNKWYLFRCVEGDSTWFNNQAYLDTLNPEAVKKFVEVTHERYFEKTGDEFDKTVPAIFTDEPQVYRKSRLNNSFDCNRSINMPWTDSIPGIYAEKYGVDIFEHLPEIIWELPESVNSPHRYYYHDLIADLFASSFAGVIGKWCSEHNISLTGHMMEEPSLESQTHSVGEAMRSYGDFGLPGIDMLCNSTELTTAKQCQSSVRQYGKEGMLSELYGVTAWDCDFRTYKYQGDWQAALGVTVRVPHLSWYAMRGEAKRDYPASISYQSPWYKKYNVIEDHFSRLNTALTRGKPIVRVGVIHPVESFWMSYGPNDKTEIKRRELEEKFLNVTDWLIQGSIDFDFVSEALLPTLNKTPGNPLKVGKMSYDAVIVPGCKTLRSTTVKILNGFKNAGGKLIFLGSAPQYIDAELSDAVSDLYNSSDKIGFTRAELISCLDEFRCLTIRNSDGSLATDYVYQLREDNDCRWLFICRNNESDNKDISRSSDISVIIKGEYSAEIWNTASGSIDPADYDYIHGDTAVRLRLYDYDSVLIRLEKGRKPAFNQVEELNYEDAGCVGECEGYSLSEDNVLLLDMAEYSVDDSEFYPAEEILRLDNKARIIAGLKTRGGHSAQPWILGKITPEHKLTLRFTFESEIDYSGADLALEDADKAVILFNGNEVPNKVIGKYVDTEIYRVALPEIKKGTNTLTVTVPLGDGTNTENMFVLGDFGVKAEGRKARIIQRPERINFGDLTVQGFLFYGGCVTYKFKAVSSGGKMSVIANYYRGALMTVSVDGREYGDIIYPPYALTASNLEDGIHDIEIKLYLHRYNTFGPVHLSDIKRKWHGPDAWRSDGDAWSYEYMLRTTGLLSAPRIK